VWPVALQAQLNGIEFPANSGYKLKVGGCCPSLPAVAFAASPLACPLAWLVDCCCLLYPVLRSLGVGRVLHCLLLLVLACSLLGLPCMLHMCTFSGTHLGIGARRDRDFQTGRFSNNIRSARSRAFAFRRA